ncbi:hypothetical protein ACEWY4_026327 [Coilia grayii]|uniref:Uncharacterized protein n=1 Tax=Coilia grayii TaxID=363190 RepID=A0ABD1IUY3_9TELE
MGYKAQRNVFQTRDSRTESRHAGLSSPSAQCGWEMRACTASAAMKMMTYGQLISTADVAAGGNLPIDLCSLHQVKLNFTQRGSSAPETLFIIDHGQAFYHPKATRGIAVTAQNDTAVLSNLQQDGTFTVIDSKTGEMLCEVNFTVTGSAHRSTADEAAGGNLPIDLCSLHQVKLNFTQRGSSAPETLFFIDRGQAFYHPKATRGIAVTAQNDTAVLSNLQQDGTFTVIDSKTGKMLCEVNLTVTESVNNGNILKAPPSSDCSWVPPCWLTVISLIHASLLTGYALYVNHQRLFCVRKTRKKSSVSRGADEEAMTKINLRNEAILDENP